MIANFAFRLAWGASNTHSSWATRSLQARRLLAISFVLWANSSAWAQAPVTDQAPPGSAARSLEQIQRWFELEAPFSRGLRFRFDTRPVPMYETLRLATYEGHATLLQRGGFATRTMLGFGGLLDF